MASNNLYVNVIEEILEMHHGAKPKLCAFWRSQMYLRARELGEAVVGIKQSGHRRRDTKKTSFFSFPTETVVIFPCGLEMTLAMRPESGRADSHHVHHSGETSASEWRKIFDFSKKRSFFSSATTGWRSTECFTTRALNVV